MLDSLEVIEWQKGLTWQGLVTSYHILYFLQSFRHMQAVQIHRKNIVKSLVPVSHQTSVLSEQHTEKLQDMMHFSNNVLSHAFDLDNQATIAQQDDACSVSGAHFL